jgi:hypothetical protein
VPVLEVACDESGSEGEKLIGATTDVFAHAGVLLDAVSAAECIRELRSRGPTLAQEYKANHVLREKNRRALTWLLGPSGLEPGHARVYLVDKAFFVIVRLVYLLADGHCEVARGIYRDGRALVDRERWHAFLTAANNLMRAKNRLTPQESVDAFFRALEALDGLDGAREQLLLARPRAAAYRAGLLDGPADFPALDPLIPAVVRAVEHWGTGGRSVAIVHDRQTTLSDGLVARLKVTVGAGLSRVTLADSRVDPRVQVADVLAGAARKIASDELNGRGGAELTALLRPYVDPWSIWGDERSGAVLGLGQPSAQPSGEDT